MICHAANNRNGSGTAALIRAHRQVAKAQRRIARDVAAGRTNRAKKRRRLLLNSHSAKLVANARAHRRARTGMPEAVVRHGAQFLDPWRGSRGLVRRRAVDKPNGGERVHYAFGAEGRALQYLARLALEPGADRPWNMMAAGRGKDAMARRIAELMAVHTHFVVADIRGAYDSMSDPDGVAALLPLPRRVTMNTILGGNLRVAGTSTPRNRCPYGRPTRRRRDREARVACYGDLASSHPRPDVTNAGADHPPLRGSSNPPGVVQGSACGDLAMAWLLMPVAEQIGPCLIYGDDIVAWADSEEAARGIRETLGAALSAHPAGNIALKHCSVVNREQGIFVCGYWIRWRRDRSVVTPYPDTINLWQCRWYDALIDDEMAGRREPLASTRTMGSFRAGFPAWPQGGKFIGALVRRAGRYLAWLDAYRSSS